MNKQIDPNLSGADNDEILASLGGAKPTAEKSSASPEDSLPTDESNAASEPEDEYLGLKQDVKSYHEAVEEARREKAEQNSHRHHHHSSSHGSDSHRHSRSHKSSHSHSSSSSHGSSHSHSSSSKGKKKKRKLPLALKIAIIILLILLLAFGTVFGTFLYLRYQGKKDIMPVITEDTKYEEIVEYKGHKYKYNENVVALAFIGVDQRQLETSDNTDFVGAADADLVIAIDTETGTTKVIAIPRDTMVDIDMYSADTGLLLGSDHVQLCLAYAYGDGAELSCQNTVDAMSRILNNVPIQKYFTLDLDGIAPLNDAIGGVEIGSSLYALPDYGISIGDKVTLKGDMAERYVRTRDNTVEASLNRTERQVQYVKAYSQQVLPAVVRDFSTVSKLYNTAKSYSRTNLTLSNATYISSLLLQKNVRDFTGVTLKGTMTASPDPNPDFVDVVHAEFEPDPDFLQQTVLDAFYTQIE
ncbi:MAG: LytR family transcriptional regulator [Ruminococcaceae bacterium]|nr:LytR family transcriptional regulator [Oscillospiraceae bacterium]